MELHAEHSAPGDRADERRAVCGLGKDELSCGRALRATRIRMHEVEVRAVGDLLEGRVIPMSFYLVPADVGEPCTTGQDPRAAPDRAQGLGAVLVAAIEQQLQPKADPEEPPVGLQPGPDRADQSGRLQPRHGGRSRADSRDNEQLHIAQVFGPSDQAGLGSRDFQPARDAYQVAGAVVDDPDERAPLAGRGQPSAPLVEATPVRRGSGSVASPNARPSALKAASARWWSLRPAPLRWTVTPAVRASDSIACCTKSSGSAPTRSPLNGRSTTAYGRPPTSTAAVASDSSMGTLASPNRLIPERSPRASASAEPRASATSSTVWCSS